MTTYAFSCLIDQKMYTGTLFLGEEAKADLSKLSDKDQTIRNIVISAIKELKETKKNDISIKITKDHKHASVKLLKGLWKEFTVPEVETEETEKSEPIVKLDRQREFSVVLGTILRHVGNKISKIFRQIFAPLNPASFGIKNLDAKEYQRAVDVLNLIDQGVLIHYDDEEKPILGPPLSNKDRELVQNLLKAAIGNEAAIGNKDLNRYLHAKKNPSGAEEFLDTLAFVSQKKGLIDTSIRECENALNDIKIKEIETAWKKTVNKGWKGLEDLLKAELLKEEEVKNTDIIELLEKVVPQHTTIASLIFTHPQKYIMAIDELKKKLDSPELKECCDQLKEGSEDIRRIMKGFEEMVDTTYDGPVKMEEIRTIDTLQQLAYLFVRLGDLECVPENCESFKENSKKAFEIFSKFNRLLQMYPDSIAGDISFTHEILQKNYTGSHETRWSREGVSKLQVAKEVLKGPQRIFHIQPYFGGASTHAALLGVDDSYLTTFEIVSGTVKTFKLKFYDVLQNICYRPDFSKLFADEKSGAEVRALFGKKAKKWKQDVLNKALEDLFAERLASYLGTHKEDIEKIQLSMTKAVGAHLIAMAQKRPSPLAGAATAIFQRLFGCNTSASSNVTDIPGTNLRHQMICSEFVAAVYADVQQKLENDLHELYKKNNNGQTYEGNFFIPLIPSDIPKGFFYPGKLQEVIENKCKLLDPPLIVRLLVKGMNKKMSKIINPEKTETPKST